MRHERVHGFKPANKVQLSDKYPYLSINSQILIVMMTIIYLTVANKFPDFYYHRCIFPCSLLVQNVFIRITSTSVLFPDSQGASNQLSRFNSFLGYYELQSK